MIHARPDYNRIQDPANLIPADMPVFLLVGKDKHAAATVRFWADAVEADGGDPEIVRIARAHADLMAALAIDPGLNAENVMVVLKETSWENWAFGGGRQIHV